MPEISGVFTTVERMLREDKLGTFSHMITHAYQLLQQEAELAAVRAPASSWWTNFRTSILPR